MRAKNLVAPTSSGGGRKIRVAEFSPCPAVKQIYRFNHQFQSTSTLFVGAQSSMGNEKNWITLNVGGKRFVTARSTLTKSGSNSPLHKISSNSTNIQWDRDENGAYLIDRDPNYFQSVLNYLRHGRLIIKNGLPEEGVLVEAEYYILPELIKAVKQRMALRRSQWIASLHNERAYGRPYGLYSSNLSSNPLSTQFCGPATVAGGVNVTANHQNHKNTCTGFSQFSPSVATNFANESIYSPQSASHKASWKQVCVSPLPNYQQQHQQQQAQQQQHPNQQLPQHQQHQALYPAAALASSINQEYLSSLYSILDDEPTQG